MELSGVKSVRVLDRGRYVRVACLCGALRGSPFIVRCASRHWVGMARFRMVGLAMVVLAAVIALRAHCGGFTVHRRCLPAGVAVAGLLVVVTTICLLKGSANHHYI